MIEAVGGWPVDLFASSGGAVNALALVTAHPELVRALVAHEPPAASVLPDATNALAACQAVHETYKRHGGGHGMAHFIALISLRGPVPADFASQPAPDPAMFGMPTEDDGRRDDLMLGSNVVTVTHYRPDVDKLRSASTRIVLAVGCALPASVPNVAEETEQMVRGFDVEHDRLVWEVDGDRRRRRVRGFRRRRPRTWRARCWEALSSAHAGRPHPSATSRAVPSASSSST